MCRSMLPLFLCAWLGLAWAAMDLNSADEVQLQTLPGIGPAKARAIIDYRKAHGGFRSLDELGQVKGIGGKMLTELKPLLSVGQSSPSPRQSPIGPDLPRSSAPGLEVAAAAPASRSLGLLWGGLALGGVLIIVLGMVMLRRRAPAALPASSCSTASPIPQAVATSSVAMPVPSTSSGASAPPRPAGMSAVPGTQPGDAARAAHRPAGDPPAPPGARGRAH